MALTRFPLVFLVCYLLGGEVRCRDGIFTLEQAIVSALKHDPTLIKIYADVMEADGYSREVRSELRPHVRISADSGYGLRERTIEGLTTGGVYLFGNHASVVVEQLIWDNGFACHNVKDAKTLEKAARLLDLAQRETTAFGAVDAYLRVLRNRRQVELAKENVAIHQRYLDSVSERKNGVGSEADVELASARWKMAKVELDEKMFNVEEAESDFVRYVGSEPIGLGYPQVPVIRSTSEIKAEENYHYKAHLHQWEAAQLASTAIRRSRSPKVYFRGTGGYGEDNAGLLGKDEELSALVVVDWNLFQGRLRRGQQEQAEGEVAHVVASAEEALVLLKRDIASTWADYAATKNQYINFRKYNRGLQGTINLYRDQFKLGQRPLLSVLDVEKEKISAEMKFVDNLYEKELNVYRLLFFGGKLISYTIGDEFLTGEPELIDLECPVEQCPVQSVPVSLGSVHSPSVETEVSQLSNDEDFYAATPVKKGIPSLFQKSRTKIPKTSDSRTDSETITLPGKAEKAAFRHALGRFFKKKSITPYSYEK